MWYRQKILSFLSTNEWNTIHCRDNSSLLMNSAIQNWKFDHLNVISGVTGTIIVCLFACWRFPENLVHKLYVDNDSMQLHVRHTLILASSKAWTRRYLRRESIGTLFDRSYTVRVLVAHFKSWQDRNAALHESEAHHNNRGATHLPSVIASEHFRGLDSLHRVYAPYFRISLADSLNRQISYQKQWFLF